MSKKPDTASALAGILNARRGGETVSETPVPAELAAVPVAEFTPSPALPVAPSPVAPQPVMLERRPRTGKSSDKANYSQFSVYLRKDTRKKVGRSLEDGETGQDFSELVQELLEKWLKART